MFEHNEATWAPGALNLDTVKRSEIIRSNYTGNSAVNWDGGAINFKDGDLELDTCEFRDNVATGLGGAIYGTKCVYWSSVFSHYSGNRALKGSGGGVWV